MQSVYLQRIMKKNADRGYEKTKPKQTQTNPIFTLPILTTLVRLRRIQTQHFSKLFLARIAKWEPRLILGQKRVKMGEMRRFK